MLHCLFLLQKYINIHKEAHKLLEDSGCNTGLGMDQAAKCHRFTAGIKEYAGLEHDLSSVRSHPSYRSFTALTSFLLAEVDHKNIRKQQLK